MSSFFVASMSAQHSIELSDPAPPTLSIHILVSAFLLTFALGWLVATGIEACSAFIFVWLFEPADRAPSDDL